MDKLKLQAKIKENGMTYEVLSSYLNITSTSFCQKINEKTQFKLDEVKELQSLLNISDSDMIDIFLR